MAEADLVEFRKRFPAELVVTEQELVVKWHNCKTSCNGYNLWVYWLAGHDWHWEVEHDSTGKCVASGKDLETCGLAKSAAEAALRRELWK
jgi:hypothetical protein